MNADFEEEGECSQFMPWCATDNIEAVEQAKKRVRNPRVTAYLTTGEYRRFEAMRKHLGYRDASHIVREAILGLLDNESAGDTLAKLEFSADLRSLRQIVAQGISVLQEVRWAPIVLQSEESFENQFDADLASSALEEIRPELHLLVRRVATLVEKLDGMTAGQLVPKLSDASPAKRNEGPQP